mmetsp:Transcript_71435/g.204906  ORF Transcript_71435/g.204906 Transcript_71435/m.204906 type:complete len:206 (+) Transcript_71435:384-1001(+)
MARGIRAARCACSSASPTASTATALQRRVKALLRQTGERACSLSRRSCLRRPLLGCSSSHTQLVGPPCLHTARACLKRFGWCQCNSSTRDSWLRQPLPVISRSRRHLRHSHRSRSRRPCRQQWRSKTRQPQRRRGAASPASRPHRPPASSREAVASRRPAPAAEAGRRQRRALMQRRPQPVSRRRGRCRLHPRRLGRSATRSVGT